MHASVICEFISNEVCLCISVSQFTVGFYGSSYDYVTHILRSHASLLTSIQLLPPKMVQLKRVVSGHKPRTSSEFQLTKVWLVYHWLLVSTTGQRMLECGVPVTTDTVHVEMFEIVVQYMVCCIEPTSRSKGTINLVFRRSVGGSTVT